MLAALEVDSIWIADAVRDPRIGVTRQTVIAIEQGRYSPTLELAFQIAHVFGVGLDAVFQYPDTDEGAST